MGKKCPYCSLQSSTPSLEYVGVNINEFNQNPVLRVKKGNLRAEVNIKQLFITNSTAAWCIFFYCSNLVPGGTKDALS